MTDHPLTQLTLVRLREFVREPEAMFWTFVFPVLIAAGLGIAFRNRPADVLSVAVVGPELAAVFEGKPTLAGDRFADAEEARRALREGRVALVAERGPDGTV